MEQEKKKRRKKRRNKVSDSTESELKVKENVDEAKLIEETNEMVQEAESKAENPDQPTEHLVTLSEKIIEKDDEGNTIKEETITTTTITTTTVTVESNENPENENNTEAPKKKKKKKKKKNKEEKEEKPQDDNTPLETVEEKIISQETVNNENLEEKRENLNKENEKKENLDENIEVNESDKNLPSKQVKLDDLYEIDEEDGTLDYFEATKIYDLSIFLAGHKFITKNKNFDKKFQNLVKRKIIAYEKNIHKLVQNNKFFILYELQNLNHTDLCLTDIIILKAIKSLLNSNPDIHLIIQLSDEELLNNNKDYNVTQIKDFSKEKLDKIINYLNIDLNKLHIFSTIDFHSSNSLFESQYNKLKSYINKNKLKKNFNIAENEETDNQLNYYCALSVATNPEIYSNYIPEINNEYRCLIINSIFYMNRYLLSFDAANLLKFNEPAVIATKILPPLSGINGKEAYAEFNNENAILSCDDEDTVNNKVNNSFTNKDNLEVDVPTLYYEFIEDDENCYSDNVNKVKEGKMDESEFKGVVIGKLKEVINEVNENNGIEDYSKAMMK